MSQPSSQDFLQAFDPTGYSSISGAQLLQYITGAAPFTDKGLVVWSTDTAGVPNVPNATTTTKWQQYVWARISPTTNSVSLYVWNPNAASDATYLQWVGINTSGIAAGSIQGYQIAANTITDANIANLNYSKLIGAPATINSGSAAGGDLSGTYPNPTIAALAVSTGKVAQNAVTGGPTGKLATGANGATLADNIAVPASSTFSSPSGANAGAPLANDRVVVGVGDTAYATVRKVIDALAEPVGGDGLKLVQVNSGGTGFQYSTLASLGSRILQTKLYQFTDKKSGSGNVATNATPNYNATGMVAFNDTSGSPFVVISAASTLFFELTLHIAASAGDPYIVAAVYNATGATAPIGFAASQLIISSGTAIQQLKLNGSVASPGAGALTFYIAFGSSTGNGFTNSVDGATSLFGGLSSSLKITEYL